LPAASGLVAKTTVEIERPLGLVESEHWVRPALDA